MRNGNSSSSSSSTGNASSSGSSNSSGTSSSTGTDDSSEDEIVVTPEEMAEDLKTILKDYIDGDDEYCTEKIKYLIEAETVTKLPYIEGAGTDGEDESIVGQVKFYRFDSEEDANNAYVTDSEGNNELKETYRLKYKTPEEFEELMEKYQNNTSRDEFTELFKYFTMDDDGNVVIAYGKQEIRDITTGDSTNEKDPDLTEENVREYSGEQDYTGNYEDGFSMVRYTVYTKAIDYLSLVEQYVMPSNFLYSLLIQTKDIDFVEAIAELAYDNEIAIGIYDNESESNRYETYTYKKLLEIDAITKLDFSAISTSDPTIKVNDLYSYSNVPQKCITDTYNGRASHRIYYYRAQDGATQGETTDDEFYIAGIDSNGKITGLTDEATAATFVAEYHQQINSKATPTVGVILADTWVARWEATYTKEDKDPVDQSSSDTNEDITIQIDEGKDEVLNTFDNATKDDMTSELDTHATNLVTSAVERIVESTDFSVNVDPDEITLDSLTIDEKKSILETHLDEACPDCQAKINTWWLNKNKTNDAVSLYSKVDYSDYDRKLASLTSGIAVKPNLPDLTTPTTAAIYQAVTSGDLRGTIVETHYLEALDEYVEEKKKEAEEAAKEESEAKEEERKNKFRDEITGQITSSQTLTGTKYDVNIEFTTSSTKTSSQYKKDATVETTQIGEKFSEIFNNQEFHDSKQAVMQRESWFFEYIQENEDTAKLEDTIRILLNKATNSEKFGKYDEDDISDILKAFEPQSMQSISKIYGSTIETKVWNALINEGYSKEAVAGVMGNLYQESRFDPSIVEDGTGIGFGLCQWSYGRRTQLEAYAQSKGVDPSDVDTQIEFLITEMAIGAAGPAQGFADEQFLTNKINNQEYTRDMWLNAETPEEAAEAFCWTFERPNVDEANLSVRQEKALEYYEKYKNIEELGGIFEKNTTDDTKIIGTFTSAITGRTFTIIKQSQIKYWNLNYNWDSACNRAAQVSVCSGYWSKSTDDLILELAEAGNCVAPYYQKTYDECGLSYSIQKLTSTWTLDQDQIRKQVQNGGYVILYLRGADMGEDGISKNDTKWAGAAHWVVILGYREIDGCEEIFVSDSGWGNSGWWPIDEFDGITNNAVFVNEK